MSRRLLVLLACVLGAVPIAAQAPERALSPGDHVRLLLLPVGVVEGMYVAATSDSIRVRETGEAAAGSAFARTAVTRVELGEHGSRMVGAGKGMAIGAIAGGLLGFLATSEDPCHGDTSCDPLALVGRAIFTLGGAVVGVLAGGLVGAGLTPSWQWTPASVPAWASPANAPTPGPALPRPAPLFRRRT